LDPNLDPTEQLDFSTKANERIRVKAVDCKIRSRRTNALQAAGTIRAHVS